LTLFEWQNVLCPNIMFFDGATCLEMRHNVPHMFSFSWLYFSLFSLHFVHYHDVTCVFDMCAWNSSIICMIIMVSFNRLACVNVVTGNSDIIYFRMRNPVFLVWFIVFPIADNIETRNVMDFFWFVKHSRLKYTVRLMEPQRCNIQCRTGLYVLQPLAKHSRWTIYFSHKISCKQ